MLRLIALRSGAFRFALAIALVFAAGSATLLLVADRNVHRYATEVAADGVAAEIAVLVDEDRASGRGQTIRSVIRRENAVREHDLRYSLIDNQGRRLAGSLPVSAAQVEWHRISITDAVPDSNGAVGPIALTALGVRLADGAILVAASDNSDLDALRRRLGLTSALFGLGITVLALTGGFIVGTVFLRRLDRVNRSVEHIMVGNLGERLPTIGMSSEFDQLSTNLNRMLDRIETLVEGMRQVSTDIAHDLRTPLTRLRYRLELLKEGAGPGTEARIDAAIAQTDEILGVFRALLRISSLEAGTGRNRFVDVDLSAALLHLVDVYQPVAEDSSHALVSKIEPGVHGRADLEMLVQAVTNLIENALFHSPVGSRVSVTLSRDHDRVLIAVADDGPGIPEAERERVLRRFYRLDSSRGTPGAGLGLALVAAVATVHGARLHLRDNAPGLRVEIDLPFANGTEIR